MNKARIKEEAEHFFEWPDPKRRDHVTLASCLIFAEVIAGMAVDAEREACAKVAAEPQGWAMPSFNHAPSDRTIGRIEGEKEMSYRIASAIRARSIT